MKDLLVRFMREEEGDTVQTVIIIAVMAALALVFGKTIKSFVGNIIEQIRETGEEAGSLIKGTGDIKTEVPKSK